MQKNLQMCPYKTSCCTEHFEASLVYMLITGKDN